MTDKEIIRNFAYQYRKPFSAETIAEITAIEIKAINRALKVLLTSNKIKCLSSKDKLYVRSNRYHSQVGFNQKGKWNYGTQIAEEILTLLENKQYRSIREIAKAYGKSRQLIFVYLEALASIGMVGIDSEGYYTISKDRLLNLGIYIQPGILRELRTAAGIKPKSRNQN